MATTKMTLPVDSAMAAQAAIHFQNRLEGAVGHLKVEIERTYVNNQVTELAAVFTDDIPREQVQGAYRAMVNLWGRTDSGFTGAPSFDANYDPGLESNQYHT